MISYCRAKACLCCICFANDNKKPMKTLPKRKPTRLFGYDYSHAGYYYLTICTYKKYEYFGEIENNKMILNQYGQIASNAWLDLPNHHRNIELDEFVIMPNHIHSLITAVGAGPARPVDNKTRPVDNKTRPVDNKTRPVDNKTNNLSTVIGSYKSSVTRQINKICPNNFKWQRSFYDCIVRTSNHSLYAIREYIIDNPANWDRDENNINFITGQENYLSTRQTGNLLTGQAGLAPTAVIGGLR